MTDINMTTEDIMCAINNLKGMYQSSLDKDETYLFAIKALEKQIAKKMDRYYCPICRHYFEDGEAHNYCPECGQKLDWQ